MSSAEGHSSGDCVKQSAAITSLNGCSLIPLFGEGMMSVIASGTCNVSALKKSISERLILPGRRMFQS